MKKILKKAFNAVGLEVSKSNCSGALIDSDSMLGGFERLAQRGLSTKSVIDVGASNSQWSESILEYLPDAEYLMIEAQEEHASSLEESTKRHKNFNFVIAAAGESEGHIYFDSSSLWGGIASENPIECEKCVKVPVTTIDKQVVVNTLKAPFLIKLDTHGFEVPILKGAKKTLKDTEVLIIEVYNFKLVDGCLKFHEMCSFLDEFGFQCVDIVDIERRPKDNVLWQMDMIFMKKSRKELGSNTYA